MKISQVIERIKGLYRGGDYLGIAFDEENTRDKVLYGENHLDDACTGIVTTCWATIDVIKEAHKKGANLLIVHESLFWNHGDKTGWLGGNQVFQDKQKLLEDYGMVVWRNHDWVHSGFYLENGQLVDGIFYGLTEKLGWTSYQDVAEPSLFHFPQQSLADLSQDMLDKLNLSGLRMVGHSEQSISKVYLGLHAFGQDNDLITKLADEAVDIVILLEMVEFGVAQYAYDSQGSASKTAILSVGHFNAEEPGMAYMADFLKERLPLTCPIDFVSSGELIQYVRRNA